MVLQRLFLRCFRWAGSWARRRVLKAIVSPAGLVASLTTMTPKPNLDNALVRFCHHQHTLTTADRLPIALNRLSESLDIRQAAIQTSLQSHFGLSQQQFCFPKIAIQKSQSGLKNQILRR